MEQNVAVRNPPLTRSISSAFKSRAPLRINTLFWSFIFFPFHQLGPLIGPKVFKEKFFGRKAGRHQGQPRSQLAFTNRSISVSVVWPGANGARCKGAHSSINAIGFLLGQLTSAVAAEYAIILVHTFTPYLCQKTL
jgi:hypothetical protein